MTKHKRHVKRRAKKLLEITAHDLLLNPALLYSPQFKALPLERQFQLTSRLQILKSIYFTDHQKDKSLQEVMVDNANVHVQDNNQEQHN